MASKKGKKASKKPAAKKPAAKKPMKKADTILTVPIWFMASWKPWRELKEPLDGTK